MSKVTHCYRRSDKRTQEEEIRLLQKHVMVRCAVPSEVSIWCSRREQFSTNSDVRMLINKWVFSKMLFDNQVECWRQSLYQLCAWSLNCQYISAGFLIPFWWHDSFHVCSLKPWKIHKISKLKEFSHYCSDSDLRYLALLGPSDLRVATAAAKLTRQQREMVQSLAVSIQAKASVK